MLTVVLGAGVRIGALQVNILVNQNVPTGVQLIEFSVGAFTSQPGVTVAIR